MATVYGSTTNHWRAYMTYTRAESNTDVTVDVSAAGIQSVAWGFSISSGITCTLSASGTNDSVGTGGFTSASGATVSKSLVTRTGSAKYRWTKGKSAATKTVKVTTVNSSGYMNGTSSKSISVTVPALASYTITFNANGGSGAPGSQTKWYGETLTLSTTKPTRTGYTFLGWSTSSTATAATWQAGGSYTTNASDTLYAVWQANAFTVSYNANGGENAPASQTKTYGVNLTLSSVEPTRTGYDFLGWSTSSSATTATYAAGGTYANDASAVLYAVWVADTYTITFNANGGSGAPSAQTKTYGVPLVLSSTVPTRTNYDFLGWSTSSTATTAAYAAGGTYTTNAGALLYAVWKTAYWSPKLTNLVAKRVTSGGADDDEGTYIHVSFAWEVCTLVPNAAATCTATVLLNGTQQFQNSVTVSGTSGTESVILTDPISTDYSYNVVITFTDTYGGTSSATTIVSQSFFMLDFKAGGHGVGVGSPALETDVMRVGFDIHGLGDISMDGDVSATNGTFSGDVSGVTGTFSGAVSGASGAFTGDVSADNATFTGDVSADSMTLSTPLPIASGGTGASTAARARAKLGLATVLYSGSRVESGNITLSDSVSNYDCIDVAFSTDLYGSTNYAAGTKRIWPSGNGAWTDNSFILDTMMFNNGASTVQIELVNFEFTSATVLHMNAERYINVTTTAGTVKVSTASSDRHIGIYRVVGYKF